MIPANLTYVTFYRARLDPLDLYRLDDILNHDGSPCYDTPFSQGQVLHTPAVLQACSMGSTSQQSDSTGNGARWRPTSKRSPDTAYELATRAEPLVTPTSISIAASFNSQCSPDVSTDAVEGFAQIPWRSPLWHDPVPPAPGEDAAYDYARNTEEDKPAAVMSSIVQGDGYPPQVNLVSPEK